MERPDPHIGPMPFILTTLLLGIALIGALVFMWIRMDQDALMDASSRAVQNRFV